MMYIFVKRLLFSLTNNTNNLTLVSWKSDETKKLQTSTYVNTNEAHYSENGSICFGIYSFTG